MSILGNEGDDQCTHPDEMVLVNQVPSSECIDPLLLAFSTNSTNASCELDVDSVDVVEEDSADNVSMEDVIKESDEDTLGIERECDLTIV